MFRAILDNYNIVACLMDHLSVLNGNWHHRVKGTPLIILFFYAKKLVCEEFDPI